MIEFVCGRSGSGKTEYIMNKIDEALKIGGKVYLIVPDQQAVAAERLAAGRFPPSAFLSFEIVSFSRLADLVSRRYGGIHYRALGDSGRILLMWSAVVSVWDNLKIYGGSPGVEDRFVPELLSLVDEMQMYSVSPEDMERAADDLENEGAAGLRLAEKLREAALIYSAYINICSRDGAVSDVLEQLDDQLRERDFFKSANVFIDSFFTLTPQEMNILRYIFRDSDNVFMTFCTSGAQSGIHFDHITDFMHRAKRLAQRYGDVHVTELSENLRNITPMLRHMEKNLWNNAETYSGENDGSVKLFSCADRYHAALCTAAEIQRLVSLGARYSEIAVVAQDIEAHRGIIDTALDNCGVPYFLSHRREVSASPAAKLIYSAVSFAGGAWRREDLMECVRTGLCPLTSDEADMLDLYTSAWNINGRKSYCSGDWTLNPDGYSTSVTAVGEYVLEKANSARRSLIKPFENLADAVLGGGSVESFCRAVVNFLDDFSVYGSLSAIAERTAAEGRMADAAAEAAVWGAIMDALDVMVETVGDIPIDYVRFVRLLRKVVDSADIGTIPDGIDRVILGSAGSIRADGIRHVIIQEAAQGIFPVSASENGIFSDMDKLRLEAVGINLSPGKEEVQREALFMFYRTAVMARDSLTVMVPRSDGAGALEEGIGVSAIKEMFSELEMISMDKPIQLIWNENSAADIFASYPDDVSRKALESIGLKLNEADDFAIGAEEDEISHETAAKLSGDVIRLTQSRLDSFYSCPFSYLCRYTLKLRENRPASFSAVDVGNFMHRVLEMFFRTVKGKNIAELTDEEIVSVADMLISEYKRDLFGTEIIPARIEYMFARLRRSVLLYVRTLCEEFSQSRFHPEFFELSIGSAGAPPPVKIPLIGGGAMEIRGIIDRVDLWRSADKTYIRVVDYKTGSKKFSFSDFASGYNMQLPIYLYTLISCPDGDFRRAVSPNGNKLIPAGALYFSARPGDGTVDFAVDEEEAVRMAANSIERGGFLLDDIDVLRAMDSSGEGRYIPVKFDEGGIKRSNAVRSAEELDDAFEQMKESLSDLGTQIYLGKCAAKPVLHGNIMPCDYCKMKSICRTNGNIEK